MYDVSSSPPNSTRATANLTLLLLPLPQVFSHIRARVTASRRPYRYPYRNMDREMFMHMRETVPGVEPADWRRLQECGRRRRPMLVWTRASATPNLHRTNVKSRTRWLSYREGKEIVSRIERTTLKPLVATCKSSVPRVMVMNQQAKLLVVTQLSVSTLLRRTHLILYGYTLFHKKASNTTLTTILTNRMMVLTTSKFLSNGVSSHPLILASGCFFPTETLIQKESRKTDGTI